MPRKLKRPRAQKQNASSTLKESVVTPSTTVPPQPTATEVRAFEEERQKKMFASAEQALKQLGDYNKTRTKTISVYDKSSLLSYFQNIGNNEQNFRRLCYYMYYRNQAFRRIVNFYSTLFSLDRRKVVPDFDLNKTVNDKKILKGYNDTINLLHVMNLPLEFLKAYITCFIADIFYGIAYLDDTGFFILPLDPDYAKIAGFWENGELAYVYDMSYYRGSNESILEYLGEPLQSMYRAYGGNNSERWQLMPVEYSVCMKYGIDSYDVILSPLAGILASCISLEDIQNYQDIQDQSEIYKLIYHKIKPLSGAKNPDDYEVDPALAGEYDNRLILEALPEYVSFAEILGSDDLGVVSFDSDHLNDTNKVLKALLQVYDLGGGAELLDGATMSTAEAVKTAKIIHTNFAITSLLPQTELIVNKLIAGKVSQPAKVSFFHVSRLTEGDFKESLLDSCQNGFSSNILAYNTFNGFSEKETLSLLHFNNDVLNIQDQLIPLATSYTQTTDGSDSSDNGRPVEDGEASNKAGVVPEKS